MSIYVYTHLWADSGSETTNLHPFFCAESVSDVEHGRAVTKSHRNINFSTHGFLCYFLSKMATRWHQDGPRCAKKAPGWPQDGPKMAQDGPKMAPRWPQDGPKWPQDVAKKAQDSLKTY